MDNLIMVTNSERRMGKTTFNNPKKLFADNILIYWYEKNMELLGKQKIKVRKFLENGCIEKITNFKFHCLPIKDYNKTTHKIERSEKTGLWSCSCQFHKQDGLMCSHIKACKVFNFMNDWNGGGV